MRPMAIGRVGVEIRGAQRAGRAGERFEKGFSSGRPRRSASAIAAFSQSSMVMCSPILMEVGRTILILLAIAVACERLSRTVSPKSRRRRGAARWPSSTPDATQPLVVLGDGARVFCIPLRLRMNPGTTSPSQSTLSVTRSPRGRRSSTSRSSIGTYELLVAVLKDQVERPGDLCRAFAARRRP